MSVATFRDSLEQPWHWVAVCALLALASGCATNHSFVRGADLDAPALVSELETKVEEEALFDLTYVPLTMMDLQAFIENDDVKGYPEGHMFISVRSWLPLFGILDVDVEFFDTEHSAYERGELNSLLWGVWSRRSSTVLTGHGERTERNGKLLWVLDWGPRVTYGEPGES